MTAHELSADSINANGDLVIYDKENHQAWVQSTVGVLLDDIK